MAIDSREKTQEAFRLIGEGRIDDAENACRESLEAMPDDVNSLGLLGAILLKKGQWDEAEGLLLRTVQLEPTFAKPHEDLGALYLARNQAEEAIPFFERARVLDPEQASATRGLAVALHRAGRQEEAEALQKTLAASSPLGQALAEADRLRQAGRTEQAEQVCQEVLKRDPDNIAALRLLAIIATDDQRFVIAEGLLKRMVRLAPDNVAALRDLGRFLGDRGRYPEAIEMLERAVALDPDNPEILLNLGDMLAIVGRSVDALAAYEHCLEITPEDPAALLGRGHMLRIAGRQDAAAASYRRCAELCPDVGEAWWNLASLHGNAASDEDIATMRAELDSGTPGPDSEVAFHFALARACEQRDDYENAWQHYSLGNAGKRQLIKYDPVETEIQQRKIMEVFGEDLLRGEPAKTPTDTTPIFIVGMPRSGSTLIEQILASHSQVEGTGELPYIIMISTALATKGAADAVRYPEIIKEFDASQLTGLGRSYLHHAASHRTTERPCFTDKMPANYSHVGFIHLTLQHAKIIDARRDPMATCIANYRQLFAQGKNQSYDLVELGEYYLQYVDIMAHWDKVLPGRVLRVQYEDVVADLESEVSRLLDYCELPFEDACVSYHQSARPVNTASAEQVRQPIYKSAVEFWKNYEPYLDELREVLAPIL